MSPDLQHLSPRRKYLIGVSGGRDSVALLDFLHAAGFKKLIVCHLDHSLRGRQSTADARFVRTLAARYELPFETTKTNVQSISAQQKISIETAARQARQEFFAAQSRSHRCQRIILGNHADDRVETVLINLFRGSGRLTLAKSPSEIRVGGRCLTFIRPLYPVWRSDIDHYIQSQQLGFREDQSNAETDVIRNRIRHQLIPLLKEIFDRDITRILNRATLIASEEDDYLQSLLHDIDLAPIDQPATLSTARLRTLPLTLQRRAIHDWLKANSIPKISFEKIEECLSLLDPDKGPAKINLPGKHHARRRNKLLFIE